MSFYSTKVIFITCKTISVYVNYVLTLLFIFAVSWWQSSVHMFIFTNFSINNFSFKIHHQTQSNYLTYPHERTFCSLMVFEKYLNSHLALMSISLIAFKPIKIWYFTLSLLITKINVINKFSNSNFYKYLSIAKRVP